VEPREEDELQSTRIGAALAVIGGIVVLVGTLLELASAEHTFDATGRIILSADYIDTDDGKIVAAVGVVLIVVALVALVWNIRSGIIAIVLTGGGLAALGFAIDDRIQLDTSRGNLSFGVALYVVMAGGIIAAIGGVLTARVRSR
jgi:hypothetical protein